MGVYAPARWYTSVARWRSLSASRSANVTGSYLCSTKPARRIVIVGAKRVSRSNTASLSRPEAAPAATSSAAIALTVVSAVFATSLYFAADSASFIRLTSPSASSTGRAFAIAASSPAANRIPLPASIAVVLPITGQPMNFAPPRSMAGCTSRTTSGPAVLISMNTWSRAAEAAPFPPR